MTVSASETLDHLFSVPETGSVPVEEDALVIAAIKDYYGDRRLLNFTRHERRDYSGDASHKVRVGGALVLECALLSGGDTFARDTIEIDDTNRPFDEAIITRLGAGAPVVMRDICSHEQ